MLLSFKFFSDLSLKLFEKAFNKTFDELKEFDGFAGAIGLDKEGNVFWQESHPKIVFAAYDGYTFSVFE